MAGLVVGFATVKQTLLECNEFSSDRALAPLFADARISPWRSDVPQEGSVGERVQAIIGLLHDKADHAGRNALGLLVEVLQENYDKNDARYVALGDLARQIAQHGVDMPPYEPLRDMYLRRLKQAVNQLPSLPVIETTREVDSSQMELAKVYTALLTLGGDEQEQKHMVMREEKPKPVSSLEQLNRHDRLVLIGAPGSGKSTFVDFVVMSTAG